MNELTLRYFASEAETASGKNSESDDNIDRRLKIMSIADRYFKNVPEYYRYMYLDGYTPEQILYAARKTIFREHTERTEAQNKIDEIKIVSEVKVK